MQKNNSMFLLEASKIYETGEKLSRRRIKYTIAFEGTLTCFLPHVLVNC